MKLLLSVFLFLSVLGTTRGQICNGSVGDPIVDITFGSGTANPGPALAPGITNMQYVNNICPSDGQYTIANQTTDCFSNWIRTTDHTGDPNGYFMLINASYQPSIFFTDTIDNLCSGVSYQFAAWVINMDGDNGGATIKPNLTFSIESLSGAILQSDSTGPIPESGPTNGPGVWQEYSFDFTVPPGQNNIILLLKNNAPGGGGNDLGVDDITFRPIGPTIAVGILGDSIDTISACANSSITLLSMVDSCFSSNQYQWQISSDTGASWTDIPGANGANYTFNSTSVGLYLCRLAVSDSGNINNTSCRIESSVISISVINGITASVIPSSVSICTGHSDTLTAAGGISYIWSDGANTAATIVSPTVTSTYTVTVTNANSCSASAAMTVTVNPLPAAVINPTVAQICIGNSGTLTASGGVSYVWDNSATTAAITVSPAADSTYTVTVTDANSCSSTASKTVTVVPLPTPSVNPDTTQICIGASITLTASGGVGFQWSNSVTTASTTVSPNTTTTYSVTVTDGNNCSATASGTVIVNPLPTPIISPAAAQICLGYSDTLTASGGVGYAWSNAATTGTIIVAPTFTTAYSVTVTDTNHCANSASRTVTVIPYMVLTVDSSNITCNGAADGTTTLTAASGLPPYTYLWSTNATSADLTGLAPGPYAVTVTDNAGCSATASTSISQPPPLVVASSYIDPTCQTFINGSISINVAGGISPYQYHWSNGAQDTVLMNIGPGLYSVVVTDANNCTAGSVFSLAYIYGFTVQAVSPSDTINLGDTTTVSYFINGNYGAGFTSLWNPAYALSCTSCANAVSAPNMSTLYHITITNDTGCIATDSIMIYVVPDYAIYVPNAFTPNGDGRNDYFSIYGNLSSLKYLDIQIFDRWGELVYGSKDLNFSWDGTYQGVMQSPALFVWQLTLTFIDGHSEYKRGSLNLIR